MAESIIGILISVVVYLTLIGTADLQGINCKDKDGAPCSRDNGFPHYDPEDVADRIENWIYIVIGTVVAVLVAIAVFVVCCLFCAFCPAYKYRNKKGAVYGTTTAQQQPVTIYPQSAYPHQLNLQPSPQQSTYPGFVYSPGQEHPQLQSAPQPQTANELYYNTISEYKQPLGAGSSAGAPAEQPPLYQNPPQYLNTSAHYAPN